MRVNIAEVYDKIAEKYSKTFDEHLPDKSSLDSFLSLIKSSGKILNVGCGTGEATRYFEERGFNVVGVDFSRGMLEIAKKRSPKIIFLSMDMRSLDFEKNSFDGVAFSYSLFHVNKQEVPDVLRKANLILKEYGFIYLVMQEGEGEIIIDEPLLPSEKIYFNLYTEEEINSLLKESGFEVVDQERMPPEEKEIPYNKLVLIARKVRELEQDG